MGRLSNEEKKRRKRDLLIKQISILEHFLHFLNENNLDFFSCNCCDNLSFYFPDEEFIITGLANKEDVIKQLEKYKNELKEIDYE